MSVGTDFTINAYNVPNHRLNGIRLLQMTEFVSGDYGGVIGKSETVFSKNGNSVAVNSNVLSSDGFLLLILGGVLVSILPSEFSKITLVNNTAYFLDVVLDDGFPNDTVSTDVSTNASITELSRSSTAVNAQLASYKSNNVTLHVGSGRMARIPLFCTDDSGNFESVVVAMNRSSYLTNLSNNSYADLQAWAEDLFTHKSGSADKDSTDGRIGRLNIISKTDPNATYINHDNGSEQDTIAVIQPNQAIMLPNYSGSTILALNTSRVLDPIQIVPIINGGTGASSRQTAKNNLGIFYGTADPNVTAPTNSPKAGDIYFRILT